MLKTLCWHGNTAHLYDWYSCVGHPVDHTHNPQNVGGEVLKGVVSGRDIKDSQISQHCRK